MQNTFIIIIMIYNIDASGQRKATGGKPREPNKA